MSNQNDYIRINLSIEIPVHTAEKTVEKLQEFAANLSQLPKQLEAPQTTLLEDDELVQAIKHVGQKAQAEIKADEEREQQEEDNRKLRQKQLADARLLYDLNVVQAYRLYRRIRPDCDRDYAAYKAVGLHFDWPASITETSIKLRRRTVKAYLKLRQKRQIMLLMFKGWSDKRIAKHYGIRPRAIAKIFSELRKEFTV